MQLKPIAAKDAVIGQVLEKSAAGDPALFEWIAEDIDFRIDHFRDDADTSWQRAPTPEAQISPVGRLGAEMFPIGTEALGIDCCALGDGRHLTCFNHRFFYGKQQKTVTRLTYIVSHEDNGSFDYFRDAVTNIVEAE